MYNLRYHVASLVAVFLALAVGLLLGTVVAERGMITDQSSALVADLQRRFDEIDATNTELRAGLERDQAFSQDAADLIIANQLQGKRALIVVGAGRSDGLTAVEEALADAGATSVVATLKLPGLGLAVTEPEGLAGYLFGRDIEMASPGEDLERQVAEALVEELRTGEAGALTTVLVDAALIDDLESRDGTGTIDAVIVMAAGAQGGCDPFGLALARAMQEAGGVATAAEAGGSADGVAAAVAAQGLPAVGHVTTPQGRVSLVWVLAGRARGYYGPDTAADAYYPPMRAAD